jgi:hypothetical protein
MRRLRPRVMLRLYAAWRPGQRQPLLTQLQLQ